MDEENKRRSFVPLKIKQVLDELGVSQSELAKRIGVQTPMVNAIVKGGRGVSLGVLVDMAKALGVSIDSLIDGNDTTRIKEPFNRIPNPEYVALIKDGKVSYSAFSWEELERIVDNHRKLVSGHSER